MELSPMFWNLYLSGASLCNKYAGESLDDVQAALMFPGFDGRLRERLKEDMNASGITQLECGQRCIDLATQRLYEAVEELAYGLLAEQGKTVERCKSVEALITMYRDGSLKGIYKELQIQRGDDFDTLTTSLCDVAYLFEQRKKGSVPCDETTYQKLRALDFILDIVITWVQLASKRRMKSWNLKHPEYAGRVDILRAYALNFS